jgi:hypothetical protein
MIKSDILKKYGITPPNTKPKIIIIGDFARDLDDEHTLLIAAILHKLGLINLLAVIGNLKPAKERARVAKGTLKQLGLGDILVGVGTDVFTGSKTFPYEAKVPYMADENEVVDGYELLVKTLESAEPKSITLVLQSGLTDAVKLLQTQEELFKKKITLVAIMGGVQEDENELMFTGKYIQPDDAANITYDWSSGVWLYARLEELNIATSILTRFAVYASQIPFEMYDQMELTGNPVGKCLKDRQKPALQSLWEAACSLADSEVRGTLPPSRDRKWFVKTFCDGNDPQIDDGADIWPYVGKFNLYDPMNFISAVPVLRDRFFEPVEAIINGVKHLIIGVSEEVHGVKDVEGLRQFLVEAEVEALK